MQSMGIFQGVFRAQLKAQGNLMDCALLANTIDYCQGRRSARTGATDCHRFLTRTERLPERPDWGGHGPSVTC